MGSCATTAGQGTADRPFGVVPSDGADADRAEPSLLRSGTMADDASSQKSDGQRESGELPASQPEADSPTTPVPYAPRSTLVPRPGSGEHERFCRDYDGGFTEDGVVWPTRQARWRSRRAEVESGTAKGMGLLWMEPSSFRPVPLETIDEFPPGLLSNPIACSTSRKHLEIFRAELESGVSLLLEHALIDEETSNQTRLNRLDDFSRIAHCGENLYVRAKGLQFSRLAAVFLELYTRSCDLQCLLTHGKGFLAALERCDVNHFREAFFEEQRSGERRIGSNDQTMFLQYVEAEVEALVHYSYCVALSTMDSMQRQLGGSRPAEC